MTPAKRARKTAKKAAANDEGDGEGGNGAAFNEAEFQIKKEFADGFAEAGDSAEGEDVDGNEHFE